MMDMNGAETPFVCIPGGVYRGGGVGGSSLYCQYKPSVLP